jgi:cytochrome c556
VKFKRLVVACLGLAIAGSAVAQAKPEDLIKVRQASYRVIGWHCGRVKAILDGLFNKDEVLASAIVIQSVVNAGLGPFYAPGTDKGVGFHESQARPEAFDPANAGKLGEIAANFKKDANALVTVAATGDRDAIKAQFGNLTKNCKSCHDDFRRKE